MRWFIFVFSSLPKRQRSENVVVLRPSWTCCSYSSVISLKGYCVSTSSKQQKRVTLEEGTPPKHEKRSKSRGAQLTLVQHVSTVIEKYLHNSFYSRKHQYTGRKKSYCWPVPIMWLGPFEGASGANSVRNSSYSSSTSASTATWTFATSKCFRQTLYEYTYSWHSL